MTQTIDACARAAGNPFFDRIGPQPLTEALSAVREAAASVIGLAAAGVPVGFNTCFEYFLDCLARAEDAGADEPTLRQYTAPVRRAVARSRLVRRLQVWPRGYPGDFETIELFCAKRPIEAPGTFAAAAEAWTLACPPVQQHRNKVDLQSRAILQSVKAGASRILSIACGPSRDVRSILLKLTRTRCAFVQNDADPAALDFSARHLHTLGRRCRYVPGNIFRAHRAVAALGPYDLIVAGGLFDYLTDRQATLLLQIVRRHLLSRDGVLVFSNILKDHPFRLCMEYVTSWHLMERSPSDITALCRAAHFQYEPQFRIDSTGLATLAVLGGQHSPWSEIASFL